MINEKLTKLSPILKDWEKMGYNYSPSFDWVELNNISQQLGNTPANLGCGDCRMQLAKFLLDVIKERGL